MVNSYGTEIKRTARLISSSTATTVSVEAVSQAMKAGKGRPRPQSGLPNQAVVLSISASLLVDTACGIQQSLKSSEKRHARYISIDDYLGAGADRHCPG